MKQEEKLNQALVSAGRSVRIVRGSAFDNSCGKLISCNIIGAVLFSIGHNSLYSGWLEELCGELDCDSFFVYKLIMGFDRKYQIMIGIPDKNGEIKRYVKDDVSELGIALAKRYCK